MDFSSHRLASAGQGDLPGFDRLLQAVIPPPIFLAKRVRYDDHAPMPPVDTSFDDALIAALVRWKIELSAVQREQLRAHYDAVVETNRAMNLTRITDPAEAAIKHYADSLALLLWIEECRRTCKHLLDIGSGVGFPAVPLAVMNPSWCVTAVDAKKKKVDFLTRTARSIGLANLRCEHAHTDHWLPNHSFDVITLRAVGRMAGCLHQARPLLAPGGVVVLYKSDAATGCCPPGGLVCPDGLCCDDGDACTTNLCECADSMCETYTCSTPPVCDDGNECTTDVCTSGRSLIEVRIDGDIFRSTATHPYWTVNRGWIEAQNLNKNDVLEDMEGNAVQILDVKRIHLPHPVAVYDISVEGYHWFYIGTKHILVHNS